MFSLINKDFQTLRKFFTRCPRCNTISSEWEIRRVKYNLNLYFTKLTIFTLIEIACASCKYSIKMHEKLVRRIFAGGFDGSKLISQAGTYYKFGFWHIFLAESWKIWLFAFLIISVFLFFDFLKYDVVYGEPIFINSQGDINSEIVGKYVSIDGKIELGQVYTVDKYEVTSDNKTSNLEESFIFVPLYDKADQTLYVLFAGGKDVKDKIIDDGIVNNYNLEIKLSGIVKNIDKTDIPQEISEYINKDLVQKYKLNPTKIILDQRYIIDVFDLLLKYVPFYLVNLFLFIMSSYIDSRINKLKYTIK
ncbi:MAG: hypothetical protein N3A71_00225 [Candidatus Dojkabacteria bacterium]|nr:hypothetical protein [Candidatus Dojkabacteria bacterium]